MKTQFLTFILIVLCSLSFGQVTLDTVYTGTGPNTGTGDGGRVAFTKLNKNDKLINSNLSTKQPLLISGTNIKSINGTSLLGPGNIPISGMVWPTNPGMVYYTGSAWLSFDTNGTGTSVIMNTSPSFSGAPKLGTDSLMSALNWRNGVYGARGSGGGGLSSFSFTNSYGITGTVTNSTSTPNLAVHVDSTTYYQTRTQSRSDTTKLHHQIVLKQNQLNGTGFVKTTGTTISYDNSAYLTSIPTASGSVLGGIKIGSGLSIDGSGVVTTSGGGGAVASVNGQTGAVTVQPTLVSGTNIKTINGKSLLGPGDSFLADSTLGILYQKNTWANTNDFTATGSVTYSQSSSKINISGGAYNISSVQGTNNSVISNVLKISAYGQTMLEKWKMTVKFKINAAPSSSSYGLAIGSWSENTWARSHALGFFNMTTATYGGKSSLILGSNVTTADTSTLKLAISQNDYIIMTVERNENSIKCFVKNVTTGIGNSANVYLYDQITTTVLTPNTGSFAIIPCGGTYVIDSIAIVSGEIKKPDILLVGDSKLSGYSTTYSRRISSVLKSLTGYKVAVSAGPTDLSTNVKNRFYEIRRLAPKMTYLCIGRNDGAVANDTVLMKSNLISLRDSFNNAGLKYKIIDGIYEVNYDQTKIINFIKRTFTNYINVYDGGKKSSYVGDGTHPSFLGSYYVANAIATSIADSGTFLEKRTVPEVNFEYNNLDFYGKITGHYPGASIYPAIQNPGDIILPPNAAIRSAGFLASQQAALLFSNGSLQFNNYYLNNGFVWSAAPVTTGTLAQAMSLTATGTLYLGGPYTPFHGSSGDVVLKYDAGIAGVGAPQNGYDARYIPFTSSRNSEFRNYAAPGSIRFYTSGGVDGNQVLGFTISNTANVSTDSIFTAKNGLSITEGTNKKMGIATLSSGTVTVSNTKITANTRVMLTIQSPSGTVGTPYVSARTANTSFTITSTSGSDASIVAWVLIEP